MTQGKRRVGTATRCRLYVGRLVEAGVWLPPWLPLAPAQPPGRAPAAPTCPPFVAGRARIRFDFRQLEVAGCLDFVRPEMRGLWDRLGLLTTCEAYMRRRISNGTSWNCWGRVMPWCNRRTLGATANTPLGTGQAVATMAGACCDSEWCSSAGMLGPVPLGVLGRGPPRHQGEHLLLRQTVDSCVGTVRFPLLPLVEAAAGSVRLARRRRLCLWGLPATPAGGPGQGLQDRVLVELRSS